MSVESLGYGLMAVFFGLPVLNAVCQRTVDRNLRQRRRPRNDEP